MNIKKIIKHICKKTILVICSIMLIMIIGSGFKTVKVIADDKMMTINIADKNGICQAEDGTWNYYRNGKIDSDYTGLAENEAGWWKITNGTVDFTYNGLAENMYGWWKITNGAVDFDYTGNVSDETGIWKVVNGHVESEVEQSFAAQLPAAEEYSQLVVVESEGVHATVTMHEEQDGVWTEILRTDGAGSCYFLHCSNGRPTAGCVSVSEEDMAFILTHIGDSCGIVIE